MRKVIIEHKEQILNLGKYFIGFVLFSMNPEIMMKSSTIMCKVY